MRAVDTTVLLRLVTLDNAAQVAAAEVYVREGAWVSILALAETVWVLGAGYGRTASEQADVIDVLLNNKDLTLQDSDVVEAALELFRSRPALGFSDCLMLELARKAGHLPLGTFDRGLAKVEGTHKL